MSADNWARCPRCEDDLKKDVTGRIAQARSQYGKIPIEEFQQLMKSMAELETSYHTPGIERHQFREDYSVGIDLDGRISVDYRGCCNQCGLAHQFTYSVHIQMDQPRKPPEKFKPPKPSRK